MAEAARSRLSGALVDDVRADACTIPTDPPESDGTLEWSATTMVIVGVGGGGRIGIGYRPDLTRPGLGIEPKRVTWSGTE